MTVYPVVWGRGFKRLAECEILGYAGSAGEAEDVIRGKVPREIGGSVRRGVELLSRQGEVAWEPRFSMMR